MRAWSVSSPCQKIPSPINIKLALPPPRPKPQNTNTRIAEEKRTRLRGRSRQGRCNSRVYVPACVPVCASACPFALPHHPTRDVVPNSSILPRKSGIYGHGGFSCRKSHKIPGAHKIGAAMSGPRIAGEKFLRT